MKKEKTGKKKITLFYILGSLVAGVASLLFLPVLLDKLTSKAYHIMYPDKQNDDEFDAE